MQFLNKVFAFTIYNVLKEELFYACFWISVLLESKSCRLKFSIVNRRCRCFDNYLSTILFSSYSPATE
jgi:hypothetical protein